MRLLGEGLGARVPCHKRSQTLEGCRGLGIPHQNPCFLHGWPAASPVPGEDGRVQPSRPHDSELSLLSGHEHIYNKTDAHPRTGSIKTWLIHTAEQSRGTDGPGSVGVRGARPEAPCA